MTKKLTRTERYPGTPSVVFDALTDPDFLRARMRHVGGVVAELDEHEADEQRVRFTLRQGVRSDKLPSSVTAMMRGDLVVRREETWCRTEDGAQAQIEATISGVPGNLSGHSRLRAEGEQSVTDTELQVRISVPVVGAKIEDSVVGHLGSLLDKEAQFARDWLTEAGR